MLHRTSLCNLQPRADAHVCPWPKRFIYPLCALLRMADSQNTQGGFYWADQFPSIVTCGHWLFAYLLPLQKPSPVSPTSTKPIQKHFWKAWSGVLWCHDNSSNIIDFFPLWRPYHVLRISVVRSPRRPYWLTQIRRTVMWNLIARFVKKHRIENREKLACLKHGLIDSRSDTDFCSGLWTETSHLVP